MSLYSLLTSPLYIGKIRHKDQLYVGEHEPLIDQPTWEKVQEQLKSNGRHGGAAVKNRYCAFLRGLLYCKSCQRSMRHTFTHGAKRTRTYRYYICNRLMKEGRPHCPTPSLPANEIERVVLEQIRTVLRDGKIQEDVRRQVRERASDELARHEGERKACEATIRRSEQEMARLRPREDAGQLARLHEQVQQAVELLAELDRRTVPEVPSRSDIDACLASFDALWATLSPRERIDLVKALVSRVEFDAETSAVSITFHDAGFEALLQKRDKP